MKTIILFIVSSLVVSTLPFIECETMMTFYIMNAITAIAFIVCTITTYMLANKLDKMCNNLKDKSNENS